MAKEALFFKLVVRFQITVSRCIVNIAILFWKHSTSSVHPNSYSTGPGTLEKASSPRNGVGYSMNSLVICGSAHAFTLACPAHPSSGSTARHSKGQIEQQCFLSHESGFRAGIPRFSRNKFIPPPTKKRPPLGIQYANIYVIVYRSEISRSGHSC